MREPLPELGGEEERRVGRDAVDPGRGVVGPEGLVERSIDFDGVKESGEVGGLVKALRAVRWIDVAGPVWIGPSSGADANQRRGPLIGRGALLHSGVRARGSWLRRVTVA